GHGADPGPSRLVAPPVSCASMQALDGLRVIDMASVLAAPGAARHLADYGADVVKVEPPAGETARHMGWADPRDGASLIWKIVARNKRAVVLDLKTERGMDALLRLVDSVDVLVENMRPGTLERLGLAPDTLLARNRRLVVLRVSGFGQDGPYARRPGFATIAEAMSGFAGLSGEPDGAPLLPPIALTDEITALAGALAAAYASFGYLQPRLGSGIPYSTPRGTYRCADGVWVAVSTSTDSVACRVAELLGVGRDDRFATFSRRVEHRDDLERLVREWIARRPSAEVLDAFERAEAAIAPVYSMADVVADPHVRERQALVEVDGVLMQAPVARMSRTPPEVRHAGRALGADTDEVLDEL